MSANVSQFCLKCTTKDVVIKHFLKKYFKLSVSRQGKYLESLLYPVYGESLESFIYFC